MIQEKDFLYRVPVKTAPITTPRGQIRNPEILVDLEGGEFMHGNILDANSTNKLINQQENSLKTLIDAETSARTKGDEDLSSKIKAEQTRAEGKEKEISDKLAIVNGDSNTEGSFRKAIADVVAAAPEDLDTLKEIADKLAGNDDLHTALNQAITEKADASALANEVTRATGAESGLQAAITEKADASALANEVTRATGAESGLQAAIATKADATALSNYVLTTALNQQVDTLNTALTALEQKITANTTALEHKQPKGEYVSYSTRDDYGYYFHEKFTSSQSFVVDDSYGNDVEYGINGVVASKYQNCLATSDGTFKPISDFVLKTELPTKTSQLTNDSNFMAANVVQDTYFGLEKGLKIYSEAVNKIMHISHYDIRLETNINDFVINEDGFFVSRDSDGTYLCTFTPSGIRFEGKTASDIPTAGGSFIELSSLASAEDVSSLRVGLSKKQNKITVNTVDVTDIETADVTKLRTIVTNLINALSSSGLINATDGIE